MAAKSDAIVKLILVFVVSLLSFAVGTFVGKKYSDQQHKLASFEPNNKAEAAHRDVASEGDSTKKASAMTDEEIAKLAEEFVTDDAPEGKAEAKPAGHEATPAHAEKAHIPEAAAAHPTEAHGAVAHEAAAHESPAHGAAAHAEAHPMAHEPATHEAPAHAEAATAKHEVAERPRLPAALPKNLAQYPAGKFTVQVASFGTEEDADKRAEELKAKGYSAFYLPARVNGKTWYRVSVGQFPTESEAKSYRTEFMQKTKIESAIIQRVTN